MRGGAIVAVVIPALNEAPAIGKVLAAIPAWVDRIVVADNGSTDATAMIASGHGATVVYEPRRGYGAACLAGLAAIDWPDVIVFLDGDFSDHPEDMAGLVDPILAGAADLVIGSRVRGALARGALTPQQRIGNRVACGLMRLFWRTRYTDLGPFRAVRASALRPLDMCDRGYGWTIEMQIKAARQGLRVSEVPVAYRRRIGRSKISGTVRGTLGASAKITWVILRTAVRQYIGGDLVGRPSTKESAGRPSRAPSRQWS